MTYCSHKTLGILLGVILLFLSCTNPLEEAVPKNYSLLFTGSQYVEVPYDSTLNSLETNQFTIEAFVWTDTVTSLEHPAIISIPNSAGGEEIGLYRDRADSSNRIYLTIDAQPVPDISGDSIPGLFIEDSTSYFFAVSFDSGQVDVYINGFRRIGSFLTDSTQIDVGNAPLLIGAGRGSGSAGNYWYGSFDEIRIWRTVLTPKQIRFHYENPGKLSENFIRRNSPYDNLIGLWRFNEGAGSAVSDGSGNDLDGSITGIATWQPIGFSP